MAKSLKEENRLQLWLVIAVNALFLYGVIQANSISVSGLGAAFKDAPELLPMGFAVILATVANGLLSANTKARVVFLRWNNPLPGHRAFSEHAQSDSRVDIRRLKEAIGSELPIDALEQNRVWFSLYKSVEDAPAVTQTHKDFLLMRDYTALAALFLIVFCPLAIYAIQSSKIAAFYCLMMIGQFAVVRQAAATYGIRMVTNVLAQKSIKNAATKAAPAEPSE